MGNNGIAKVQHYVPQFLLRHFGTGKKDKVHVFDKQIGKIFETNTKNIAAESRFYDFELNNERFTVETILSKIEGEIKPIVQQLLETDSLATLHAEDRIKLSEFMAVQLTRSKWYREQFRELSQILEQTIKDKHGNETDLTNIEGYIKVPDENELAIFTARSILDSIQEFAPHFANKLWMLGATDSKHPFLIGDNPIGMQNMIDRDPRGNLGLAVPGIEIYLPLSPRRLLILWCPTHEASLQKVLMHDGPKSTAAKLLHAIRSGEPLTYQPEHVMNANSLQIAHAERFIFSSKNDFALAQEMITNHGSLRKGPRPKVN